MGLLDDLIAGGGAPAGSPAVDFDDPVMFQQLLRKVQERLAAVGDGAQKSTPALAMKIMQQAGAQPPPVAQPVLPQPTALQPAAPQPPINVAPPLDPIAAGPPKQFEPNRMADFFDALSGNDARRVNSTMSALMSRGIDRPMAEAVARNPSMAQLVLPHVFSAKTQIVNNRLIDSRTGRVIADLSDFSRQGPEIKTVENNGDKVSVTWNALEKRWDRIGPDGRPMGPDPSPGGLSSPPVPPGVNAKAFREAAAKESAKELGNVREKALASVEVLKQTARLKEQIAGAGDDLFGPIQGSAWWNKAVRTPIASIPGVNAVSGSRAADIFGNQSTGYQGPTDAASNQSKFSELQASYGNLVGPMLRQYGTNPSNRDLAAVKERVGGIGSADAKAASTIVSNIERESFDHIEKGIRTGSIRPEQIPPEIVAAGIKLGVLDPATFGVSVTKETDDQAGKGVREGTVIVNKQTGQRAIMKGGKWQPL